MCELTERTFGHGVGSYEWEPQLSKTTNQRLVSLTHSQSDAGIWFENVSFRLQVSIVSTTHCGDGYGPELYVWSIISLMLVLLRY